MIDTHCHLNDFNAFPNAGDAIREAQDAGVTGLIVVGIDEEWSLRAVALADKFENVYAVVGHHPNCVASFSPASLKLYRELWTHPKVVAIGEIGLDFYRDRTSPEQQAHALRSQLDLANELNAPLVFHCRQAYDELLSMLEARPLHPYLMHCWAGDAEAAQRALGLGCLLGVNGPLTYRKNDELREISRSSPLDRLVIETDAPWLPPEPHRGQRNHPKHLPLIARKLAEIRGIEVRDLVEVLDRTASGFFAKMDR
ncbi:MAG: TatD family hydrolase [Fimbriimonadaceae bacterium]|nr:TatD family hydrolase [Fimbriimonadaceae bacterium]